MKKTIYILIIMLLFCFSVAAASDLEYLAKEGYAVIEETQVDGDFEGCDFDKRIPLTNGLVFVCSTYSYSYAYMPDVLILSTSRVVTLKLSLTMRNMMELCIAAEDEAVKIAIKNL